MGVNTKDLKTMADNLMYIPNDDAQNYPFCRLQLVVKCLNTQLNETNQSKFNRSPQVVEPTNMKTLSQKL